MLYNASYVCYFLFPLLAVDQYLYVCQNYELKIRSLRWIIAGCFAIPMLVAVYDLCLQDDILYDYMFRYIRMSPHTNVVSEQEEEEGEEEEGEGKRETYFFITYIWDA